MMVQCVPVLSSERFSSASTRAAELMRDYPEVSRTVILTGAPGNHQMSFDFYVITHLPRRLYPLSQDLDFKQVVDVVLERAKSHPPTYQEERMLWALACECDGKCVWECEYIDAINSGVLSVLRKRHLKPRSTPAMIAAWNEWGNNPQDQALLEEQVQSWKAFHASLTF